MIGFRRHLSYANVVATLALVLALGGGTAAIAVKTKAPKNSVTTSSIRNFHVTARDLAGIRVVRVDGAIGATAACGQKERLVGGGATGGSAATLHSSFPGRNQWIASVPQGSVTAYALCLRAKPGK